jgi:uncharacterized lipoprotein YddW (UPF0748 family)
MQYSIWMNSRDRNKDDWKLDFSKLQKAGISNIFLSGKIEDLENASKYAADFNLEIHSWVFTMICNDKNIINRHPDWFTVNGLGESSLEKPQYVEYYKWLCPNHPEVQEYLKERVKKLCEITELTGVHLDYIRYCDVILPIGLQPNYNLIQTKEEPQFDYCYCEHCRSAFKQKFGIDQIDLLDTSEDQPWLKFRYDSITNIVNMLTGIIHYYNKKATAAVFPTIMQKNVRQEWHKWQLDAVYPMLYHSCYDEDLDWIGNETQKGKQLLKSTELHSGLYIPSIGPSKLKQAIELAVNGGADGVSLFDFNAMKDEHWKILHSKK